MCEQHKDIVKDKICITMNLIYSYMGVVKNCTHLPDDNDTVRETAVDIARSIVLLSSELFEDVNRVYGDTAE